MWEVLAQQGNNVTILHYDRCDFQLQLFSFYLHPMQRLMSIQEFGKRRIVSGTVTMAYYECCIAVPLSLGRLCTHIIE